VLLRTYRHGDMQILALLRDLPPEGRQPAAETVSVKLPRPAYLTDLRRKSPLGRTDRIDLTLDPYSPTLIAISDKP
jgi:hypothetical protein